MQHLSLSDVFFLIAPIAGTAINFILQILIARLVPNMKLLLAIVFSFAGGGIVAFVLVATSLSITASTWPDAVGLSATSLIVYGAAGFALFALVNLGETSLRIRMLSQLMNAPDGMSETQLLDTLSNNAMIRIRLDRIRANGQAYFIDGRFYPRRSLLSLAAATIQIGKRVVFGPSARQIIARGATPANRGPGQSL